MKEERDPKAGFVIERERRRKVYISKAERQALAFGEAAVYAGTSATNDLQSAITLSPCMT